MLMQLFSQLLSATRANIDELKTAAEQVEASATLRSVLGLCLKIGNALNQGTMRGNAKAFDVRVLPTLVSLKR